MNILQTMPFLRCVECGCELAESAAELTCKTCGTHYPVTDGIPRILNEGSKTLAEEIAVQDKVAIEYESKRYKDLYAIRYHDWWTAKMLEGLDTEGMMLDNGCGVGILSRHIPAERLTGLDISSEMLFRARHLIPTVVQSNSCALPFAEKTFDGIFCRSILHHIQQPEAAVTEMARVLKPDGWVTLAETNTSILSWLPRIMAKHGGHFSDDHQNLSKKKLEDLLGKNFAITKVTYFGYAAYPVLGFPDILPAFKYFPLKKISYSLLMGIDTVLSKIPLLNSQSWGIFVQAKKR
ncbi:MAG: methyltransferase domain-containing protein [Deltaproteobacteria bacterium]|jgi:ubiquinone/menaquinone biosynthesis C-methylase UbiE|nr:methyltransferase domain-containing protein [Deltaproteobacteria bacterium]